MRVPMLVRYPRMIEAGTRREEMVILNDIAPTVLDLAGEAIPEDVDGISWRPLMTADADERPDWRRCFMFDCWSPGRPIPGQRAVRTDRYKLITYPYLEPHPELYDLKADPLETRNLASDPAYATVLANMQQRLDRITSETQWTRSVHIAPGALWAARPIDPGDAHALRTLVDTTAPDPSGARLGLGREPVTWQRLSAHPEDGAFDLASALNAAPGETVFLAMPAERLTDWDPHAEVSWSPNVTARCYVNGRLYDGWNKGPAGAAWALRFNPPLAQHHNMVVMEIETPEGGRLKLDVMVYEGTIRLPST